MLGTTTAAKLKDPAYGTGVHIPVNPARDRTWLSVGDDLFKREGETVRRLQLDVPEEAWWWMYALARYWNEMAAQRKERRRQAASRKNIGEAFVLAQIDRLKEQLRPSFEANGPFPDARAYKSQKEYREAMKKYVAKVISWDKKMGGGK